MQYRGGKNGPGVYHKIINEIPPHEIYVEPFLGSGSILRHKKPASISYGIDQDSAALDAVAGELPAKASVHLVQGCGMEFLEKQCRLWKDNTYFQENAFVYCDPPYLRSTRSFQGDIYKYEMTRQDHKRLINILLSLPCPVALSGYSSKLYEMAFGRWRRMEFPVMKRNGEKALECVWMNYPAPLRLHDYQYLGENFRERERIKRKIDRWKNKLSGLDILERRVIMLALSSLDENDDAGATSQPANNHPE